MEYYRTGKILWTEANNFITKQELQIEMDFFQISYELPELPSSPSYHKSFPQRQDVLELLQKFMESLKTCICESSWNLRNSLKLSFHAYPNTDNTFQVQDGSDFSNVEVIEEILKPFTFSGRALLDTFKSEIEAELNKSFGELIELEIYGSYDVYINVTFNYNNIL